MDEKDKASLFDECWLFLGSKNGDGYGTYGGTTAHRLSWEIHRGEIPKGKWVLHHCDNPPCINPDHLYTGSASDNNFDMYRRRRRKLIMPGAKLTWEDVEFIRTCGLPTSILRKRYGVARSTIQFARSGYKWKTK